MKKIVLGFVIGLFSLLLASDKLVEIKMDEAKKYFDEKSALFVDARGYKLYQAGTIMGSLNVPVSEYDKLKKFLPADKSATIIPFCNGYKCEHSDELAELMQEDGYKSVKVYKGGYPEWKENDYPLMGLVRECKDESDGEYEPTGKKVTINGAEVYLVDGDETMIDQFWFAEVLKDGVPEDIVMIDVRKPEQYKEGHIEGAINVPFVDDKLDTSKLPKDKLAVIYCNTGMTSTDAMTTIDDKSSVLMFDATIDCEGTDCEIEPNELLLF
ncbi:MAG: rhodanese-like domain-containing protein [Campylobacterales bacterium]